MINPNTREREFFRWRDAPFEQRAQIAREQFFRRASIELFPDFQGAQDIASAVAPNGKRVGECTAAEMGEMVAWAWAVLSAGRDAVAKIKTQRKAGHARI